MTVWIMLSGLAASGVSWTIGLMFLSNARGGLRWFGVTLVLVNTLCVAADLVWWGSR